MGRAAGVRLASTKHAVLLNQWVGFGRSFDTHDVQSFVNASLNSGSRRGGGGGAERLISLH